MSISSYTINDWSKFLDEFESGDLTPPKVEVIEPDLQDGFLAPCCVCGNDRCDQ